MLASILLSIGNKYFLVPYGCTNNFLGGIECRPLLLNKEVLRRAAPKEPVHNLLMPCCQFVNGPFWSENNYERQRQKCKDFKTCH